MYRHQQQLQASLWEVAVQVQAGFKVQLHHLVSMVYLQVLRMQGKCHLLQKLVWTPLGKKRSLFLTLQDPTLKGVKKVGLIPELSCRRKQLPCTVCVASLVIMLLRVVLHWVIGRDDWKVSIKQMKILKKKLAIFVLKFLMCHTE
jgi:hypothetical protein